MQLSKLSHKIAFNVEREVIGRRLDTHKCDLCSHVSVAQPKDKCIYAIVLLRSTSADPSAPHTSRFMHDVCSSTLCISSQHIYVGRAIHLFFERAPSELYWFVSVLTWDAHSKSEFAMHVDMGPGCCWPRDDISYRPIDECAVCERRGVYGRLVACGGGKAPADEHYNYMLLLQLVYNRATEQIEHQSYSQLIAHEIHM